MYITHLHKNNTQNDIIEGKIEGRVEVTGEGERRRKQLLDDLQETTEYRKLKKKHWVFLCWELALEDYILITNFCALIIIYS